MDKPVGRRSKDLYLAAKDLEADARQEFLDRECAGDSRLREEVEQLLGVSDTETFLASPLRSSPQAGLRQGEMIGHFQIDAPIGKGGFGLVYRAIDTRLRRAVAIKILLDGSDSDADT